MNSILETYTLGFYDNHGIQTLYAKQNDTERWVKFKLENKQLGNYIVENNLSIIFKEKYSNDNIMMPIVLPTTCIVDDNTALLFQLTSPMVAVAGTSKCEISIIQSDGEITFGADGQISNLNYKQLTTVTFNLYVDASVNNGSVEKTNENLMDLTSLTIVIQKGELDRIRNENERIAFEGKGIYNDYEDLEYEDENGEFHTVPYEQSRRGLYERLKAMNEGGSFIDEDGTEQTFVNEYVDLSGNTVQANTSDLDNISYKALAAYMKSLADDNYWARLSESFAHGNTEVTGRPDENTDNAQYYSEMALEYKEDTSDLKDGTEEYYDEIKDMLDGTIPDVYLDYETGHLMWRGGIFNFVVNPTDGHLYWEVIGNPGYGSGNGSGGSSATSAEVEALIDEVDQLHTEIAEIKQQLTWGNNNE